MLSAKHSVVTDIHIDFGEGVFVIRFTGGNHFTAVNGYEVEPPLSPADSDVFVSEYGYAYVTDGNRIKRSFAVDGRFGTAGGCVIGERLYYPNGSVINGYDISSGNKVSSYRLSFETLLLYADSGNMIPKQVN